MKSEADRTKTPTKAPDATDTTTSTLAPSTMLSTTNSSMMRVCRNYIVKFIIRSCDLVTNKLMVYISGLQHSL